MALDAANKAYLEKLSRSGLPDMRAMPIAEYRRLLADAQTRRAAGPAVGVVEDMTVDGPDEAIPVRAYVPDGSLAGAIVYLHGGGWTVGGIAGWDATLRRLALAAGCAVLSVEYRLAPEHRFPAAFDDTVAAIRWAAARAGERWSGRPLVAAGDSAGANLAAAAALLLRGDAAVSIAAQVLVYPVVSADMDLPSLRDLAPPRLTRDDLAWYCDQYAPDPRDRADPRLSPLDAPDVAGLPPTLILTAEEDILRGQGEAYARRLVEAGVPVTVRRHLGTMHGFLTAADDVPQSAEGLHDIATFVCAALK